MRHTLLLRTKNISIMSSSIIIGMVMQCLRVMWRSFRMRKEGEGGCSLPNLRSIALLGIGTLTIFILYTVVKDQDTVRQCHAILGAESMKPVVDSVRRNVSKPAGWDYNWDRKQYKDPEEAKNAGVRTIILVRHGNYDLNTGKLTPLGEKQAEMTGQRLKVLNMNYKMIYHSTMERAMQTANIIHKYMPTLGVVADDDIEEGGPVPPEPTVNYWSLPDRAYFTDGPRLEAAFRKYFYRNEPTQQEQTFEILVGHANIFKFFFLRALQFPGEAWMRFFIAHASITLFHINPDGTVTMTRLGDSGHFPPEYVTY